MEKKENILEEKYRKENINISEEKYMKEAIKQAQKAYAIDEVPIGCVIVKENKIIARAYNKRNTKNSKKGNYTEHAVPFCIIRFFQFRRQSLS